jgi:diguanylate cyclase (GGDEF)-like protein
VSDVERQLLDFVDALGAARDLPTALRLVTSGVTQLLGTGHASLRLLDDSRTKLLLASRTGRSLHDGSDAPFVVGEGLVGWVVANAKALRVGSAAEDARFAARPGRTWLVSFLGAPLVDDHGCFGVLATTSPEHDAFDEADETRLRLIAALSSQPLQVHRLRRLAETDVLTGLSNRRALEHLLAEHADRDASVAVVMLDVDHFKNVNDRHGHAVGDRVLADIAQALRAGVRLEDSVIRFGGEEFLLVLPGARIDTAFDTAERVRTSVRRAVTVGGEPISISAGVAVRRENESRDALLARADAALYEAKGAGRDRTVRSEP